MRILLYLFFICASSMALAGCASRVSMSIDRAALMPAPIAHKLIADKFGLEPQDYSKFSLAFYGDEYQGTRSGQRPDKIKICPLTTLNGQQCATTYGSKDDAISIVSAFISLGAPIDKLLVW